MADEKNEAGGTDQEYYLAERKKAQDTIRMIDTLFPGIAAAGGSAPAEKLPDFKTKMEVSDYLLGKGLDRGSEEYLQQFRKLAVNLPTF